MENERYCEGWHKETQAFTPCIFCGKPVPYVRCMEHALCKEHSEREKQLWELMKEVLLARRVDNEKIT